MSCETRNYKKISFKPITICSLPDILDASRHKNWSLVTIGGHTFRPTCENTLMDVFAVKKPRLAKEKFMPPYIQTPFPLCLGNIFPSTSSAPFPNPRVIMLSLSLSTDFPNTSSPFLPILNYLPLAQHESITTTSGASSDYLIRLLAIVVHSLLPSSWRIYFTSLVQRWTYLPLITHKQTVRPNKWIKRSNNTFESLSTNDKMIGLTGSL